MKKHYIFMLIVLVLLIVTNLWVFDFVGKSSKVNNINFESGEEWK